MQQILNDICDVFNKSPCEILNYTRDRHNSMLRQLVCYVAFYYTQLQIQEIAKFMGDRDYSAIKYNIQTACNLIDTGNEKFMSLFNAYAKSNKETTLLKRIKKQKKFA